MKISIIIPVYNAEGFLRSCVDSVTADTGRDWELILVNDGSTDGSGSLCDGFARADDRIRVIHQENRGPGGARNAGLEAAKGEYVLFVDSDDTLVPGALEKLRGGLERFGADIVTFDYLADDGSGSLIPTKANLAPENVAFRLEEHPEFLSSMPATWARLWKRSLYIDNGVRYPERAFYGEDLQTSCKLFALAESIVYLPEPLYRYLDRPGSLMNTASPARNRHMLTALGDLTDWYAARGLGEKYGQRLCGLAVEHLLMATTVRVAKAAPEDPLLPEIRAFMEEKYPAWRESEYVRSLRGLKKLALWLIHRRYYRLLGWLFRMKG